jgi:hypothetical protein
VLRRVLKVRGMKWQECEDNYIMGKYIIYTHYQLVSVWSSQRKVDEQGSGIFGHLCEDMKIILNEVLKNYDRRGLGSSPGRVISVRPY